MVKKIKIIYSRYQVNLDNRNNDDCPIVISKKIQESFKLNLSFHKVIIRQYFLAHVHMQFHCQCYLEKNRAERIDLQMGNKIVPPFNKQRDMIYF